MDNLAHTLAALALARTRLGRVSPLATPALVVAAKQIAGLGCDVRDLELVGGLLRAFDDRVGNGHHTAAWIAAERGQVRRTSPGAGAEHTDSHGW